MPVVGTTFGTPLLGSQKSVGNKYAYRHRMGLVPCEEFMVFHDDWTSSIASNAPAGWTAIIDTGATVVADTTVGAGHGTGSLLFDSDGATEGAALYTPKWFQLTSGKRFFMECRFKTEAADDTDVQFGLTSATATTNPEDLWTTTATDLIAFGVLDGDATVTMLADKSNGGTSAQLGTIDLSNSTWHTMAIAYDGGTVLQGYVDGKLALTWSSAITTVPLGVVLSAFVGYRNGSTANNEGQCDYVRIISER